VGVPVEELTALNPSLLRMTTPPNASFDLHLPGGTSADFQKLIALIPEGKRNAWRYHHVAAGDTLASVALKYRVTETALAAANHIRVRDGIEGVDTLFVPTPPIAEPVSHPRLYTVRKGDTLVTISDRFGVSLSELRRWNKITGTKVQPGQRLYVAAPASVHHTAARARRDTGSSASPQTRPVAPKQNPAPAVKKPSLNHPTAAAPAKKSGTANAERASVKKSEASAGAHKAK
jgi:membrane-bound lytic murein transglycosylase D